MGWREIRKREGFFLFSTGGEAKEDRNRISASLPALAHARHKFLFYESYSYSRVASSRVASSDIRARTIIMCIIYMLYSSTS